MMESDRGLWMFLRSALLARLQSVRHMKPFACRMGGRWCRGRSGIPWVLEALWRCVVPRVFVCDLLYALEICGCLMFWLATVFRWEKGVYLAQSAHFHLQVAWVVLHVSRALVRCLFLGAQLSNQCWKEQTSKALKYLQQSCW